MFVTETFKEYRLKFEKFENCNPDLVDLVEQTLNVIITIINVFEKEKTPGPLGTISQREKGESGLREQDGYKYLQVLFLVEESYFWSCLIAHKVSKYKRLSTL